MTNFNNSKDCGSKYNILIASYLEPEYVNRIRQVDDRFNVIYEPELLQTPRYAADHKGEPTNRTPDNEVRWQQLLSQADILFDFDETHLEDLPDLAPNVRWVQATSSGIGQKLKLMDYSTRMANTIFTTAGGVHAQPLAEFCLMVMLMFNKGLYRMISEQKRKHWERYAGTDFQNRTLAIIGIGRVGREIARVGKAMNMRVIGVDREEANIDPASVNVDQLYTQDQLHEVLPQAEYLVIIVPHTPETEKMIGAAELALLPKGAIFINISRGAVIDESALVKALQSGHLGGAGLDVFAEEPLPENSPFWEMENVLISPHSASTSDRENSRITDIFCENLRRFLANKTLINILDTERLF